MTVIYIILAFMIGACVGILAEAFADDKALREMRAEKNKLEYERDTLAAKVRENIKNNSTKTVNILDRRDAENGDLFNPF